MNKLLPKFKVDRVTGVRIDEYGELVVYYTTLHSSHSTRSIERLDTATRDVITELITKALYNLQTT